MKPPERPPMDPKAEREAKLAQALRSNLRRRKASEGTPKPPAKTGGQD